MPVWEYTLRNRALSRLLRSVSSAGKAPERGEIEVLSETIINPLIDVKKEENREAGHEATKNVV